MQCSAARSTVSRIVESSVLPVTGWSRDKPSATLVNPAAGRQNIIGDTNNREKKEKKESILDSHLTQNKGLPFIAVPVCYCLTPSPPLVSGPIITAANPDLCRTLFRPDKPSYWGHACHSGDSVLQPHETGHFTSFYFWRNHGSLTLKIPALERSRSGQGFAGLPIPSRITHNHWGKHCLLNTDFQILAQIDRWKLKLFHPSKDSVAYSLHSLVKPKKAIFCCPSKLRFNLLVMVIWRIFG